MFSRRLPNYRMNVVFYGATEPTLHHLTQYQMNLPLNDRCTSPIKLLCVPHITKNPNANIDFTHAYTLFPHVPKGAL